MRASKPFFSMPSIALISEIVAPGVIELSGVSAVTTQELPAGGLLPENLTSEKNVQSDQTIKFVFNWTLTGFLANSLHPLSKFTVRLFFEKWGHSEFDVDVNTPPLTVPYSAGTIVGASRTFQATLYVPGGSALPGLYDIAAVINFEDQLVNPGPVAAFAEFGKVQVYPG